MKAAIQITGKDFGAIGLTDAEHDDAYFARLDLVESFDLVGGGCILGVEEDLTVDAIFDRQGGEVTVKFWKEFCNAYRAAFPTFDGHIFICDSDHVTSEDAKILDAFNNLDLD